MVFPWYLWVIAGIFLGGILFNGNFRKESDAFLAHLMGLEPKDKKRNDRR